MNYIFEKGDKIIQLVILPILKAEMKVVDDLSDTERGNNGFGSTGR
jgi:dUTP pyrophosphatase